MSRGQSQIVVREGRPQSPKIQSPELGNSGATFHTLDHTIQSFNCVCFRIITALSSCLNAFFAICSSLRGQFRALSQDHSSFTPLAVRPPIAVILQTSRINIITLYATNASLISILNVDDSYEGVRTFVHRSCYLACHIRLATKIATWQRNRIWPTSSYVV